MKNILKSFLVIAFAAIGLSSAQAEDLKIATVSMNKLFKEYHKTAEIDAQLKSNQEVVQKKNAELMEHIKGIQSEIEKLSKQQKDATLSQKKRLDIEREIKVKYSEGNAADSERREYLQKQLNSIREMAKEEHASIFKKIEEVIANYAREQDYDMIVNRTSRSANGAQIFAFSKDKFDVTDELLKQLNKDAPAKEAETAPADQ